MGHRAAPITKATPNQRKQKLYFQDNPILYIFYLNLDSNCIYCYIWEGGIA